MIAIYHGSVNQNKVLYDATIKSVQSLQRGDSLICPDSMGVCFWAACAGIQKGLPVTVLGAGEKPQNAVDFYREGASNFNYRQISLKHLRPTVQDWLLTQAKENDILSELDALIVDEYLISQVFTVEGTKLFMLTDGINRRTARVYKRVRGLHKPIGYLLAEPSEIVTPLSQLL